MWLSVVWLAACDSDPEPVESGGTSGAESGESPGSEMGGGDDPDAGTTGAATDPCEAGGPAGVELGHGLTSFAPFGDEPAELIYGPQGGFHIEIGVRAWGLDDSDVAVARLRGLIDGAEVGSSAPYAMLECTPDGTALEALRLPLIWDTTPEMLHDAVATVELELTDAAGTVVTASGETLIFDPLQD